MTKKTSTIPLSMRWIAIILGMVFLFWIPFEDTSTLFPILFSIALATMGASIFLSGNKKPFRKPIFNYVLAGSIAGIAITPLTLFLMAFKTGLHGHQAPDFTNQQVLSIVYRIPIWTLGGILIGLGFGLWSTDRVP